MGKFLSKIKKKKDEMLFRFAFTPIGKKIYFSDCKLKEEFNPSTYSLWLICKHVNREASFYDIRNAIYDAAGKKEVFSYRVDIDNPGDIMLDEEGILDYYDVLISYFGEHYIDELYICIKNVNEIRKELHAYKKEIKNYGNELLRKILDNLERYPDIKGVKMNEYHKEMIDIVKQELEYREKNNIAVFGEVFDPEIHHCRNCMIPKSEWQRCLLSYDGDECKLLGDFFSEFVFFESDSVVEKFVLDHSDMKNPLKTLLELLDVAFDAGVLSGKQYESVIEHIEGIFAAKGGAAQ